MTNLPRPKPRGRCLVLDACILATRLMLLADMGLDKSGTHLTLHAKEGALSRRKREFCVD